MIKFFHKITKEGSSMTQNSLSKAYLSNPKLNESFQSAVSAAADALELLCNAHNDNLSEVVNLATNLINEIGNRYIHTALDCYLIPFSSRYSFILSPTIFTSPSIIMM